MACGHLVQERSQTVDVHSCIASLASDLFRCHVVGRSESLEEASKRSATHSACHGYAEVHDSYGSIAAKHHVDGIEAAMDDIVAMHVFQDVADQRRNAKSLANACPSRTFVKSAGGLFAGPFLDTPGLPHDMVNTSWDVRRRTRNWPFFEGFLDRWRIALTLL
jgi:hypothetical protein